MRRRDFLLRSGLALGSTALLGAEGRAEAKRIEPAAAPPKVGTWPEVKAEFGLAPGLAHMSGFFLASHPRVVRDAIDAHRRGLDLNPFEYVEANIARLETAVHQAAADYAGAAPDDFALTDSTTMGLGTVYGGMRLKPGQEILSTTHDHIVTIMSCQHRAARSGATYRQVPLYDDPAQASAPAIVAALARAIKPETRVIAVTWVHSGTGVKLPIRAMADAVEKANAGRAADDRALLCVDGVHGFGIEDVRLPDLGCDFFVAGCHKWIFGPRGTGLVWGRPDAWKATQPTIPSMDRMWRSDTPDAAAMTPGGFHSFEHRWALEPAFRFHLALGKARVAARIHELNRHVREELAKLAKVRLVTPASDELSAGITCFDVAGLEPREAVARLRQKNVVASVTPGFYKPPYVRLSAGLVTLEADVDRALAAVRTL